MKKAMVSAVMIISLLGCAAAFDGSGGVGMRPGEAEAERLFDMGIGRPWVGGDPPHGGSFDIRFSQYYSWTGWSSSSMRHIEPPRKPEVRGKTPSTVYFSYSMQAVPYVQYETYPTYGANALWILGETSWTQYAQVPLGSSLSLLATSSLGGRGCLYEIDPFGTVSANSLRFFTGSSQLGFYADKPGRHQLYFVVDGQVSNRVTVDVVSFYQQHEPPVAYPPPSGPYW